MWARCWRTLTLGPLEANPRFVETRDHHGHALGLLGRWRPPLGAAQGTCSPPSSASTGQGAELHGGWGAGTGCPRPPLPPLGPQLPREGLDAQAGWAALVPGTGGGIIGGPPDGVPAGIFRALRVRRPPAPSPGCAPRRTFPTGSCRFKGGSCLSREAGLGAREKGRAVREEGRPGRGHLGCCLGLSLVFLERWRLSLEFLAGGFWLLDCVS